MLASYSFSVAAIPVLSAENASSVQYSFNINQDAVIEADFSDKITRNAAQIALQSTILEQVTAYVSKHEEDDDFHWVLSMLSLIGSELQLHQTQTSSPASTGWLLRENTTKKYTKKKSCLTGD